MKAVRWALSCALCAALAACGGSDSPSSPAPGPGGGETISGSERLGWNQTATSAAELAAFRYAIYVDGARSEVAEVSCSSSGAAYACSGRLPAMTPGSHVIEVATFVLDGSNVVESPRSSPLTVTVRATTAGAGDSAALAPPSVVNTSDGVRLAVDMLSNELDRPVDIAVAGDGRLFLAEQSGRIRVLTPGSELQTAVVLDEVLVSEAAGGLLAIALDPDFDRTRFLFALYTTAGRHGDASFRLVRLREAGGTLAERVVLLDDIPASPDRPSGSIRFGPDARLYVALDDGGDPDEARRLASYSGKVLRLERDGTTPADQPSASPVHAIGLGSPRGLDWQPGTGALWVVDDGGGDPHASAFLRESERAGVAGVPFVRLPVDSSPRASSFYGLAGPFEGDLLVAAGDALLRMRLGGRTLQQGRVPTERLLGGEVDAVRAIAVGSDGSIYVATGTALLRLRPEDQGK